MSSIESSTSIICYDSMRAVTSRHPGFRDLIFAARPGFLTASITAVLIGLAVVRYTGHSVNFIAASLTMVATILVHAGINVLNDYYDSLSGTDAINSDRIFPYTGGSRFIQSGRLTEKQTLQLGITYLALAAVVGLFLAWISGPGLLLIGLSGILLGWAYSAPPLVLCSRALGEPSVAIGFGMLIPLGTWYAQVAEFSLRPIIIGIPYACLVAALLVINQFPDLRSDTATGKANWVVRLGRRRARWLYALLAIIACGTVFFEAALGILPAAAVIAALPLLLNLQAALILWKFPDTPAALTPAIQSTIMATVIHGGFLSVLLVLTAD